MKRRTYQNVFLRVPQPRFGVEKTVDAGSQTGRRRRRRCSRRCLSLLCLMCHNSTNSSSLIKSFFLCSTCDVLFLPPLPPKKQKQKFERRRMRIEQFKKRRNAHNKSVYATRELMMMRAAQKRQRKSVCRNARPAQIERGFVFFRCSLPLIAHREERSTLGELTLCLMP